MTAARTTATQLGIAAGTVLTATLLSGCGGSHINSASSAMSDARLAKADAKAEKAVIRAEQTTQRTPEDPAVRAALGQSYLAAGRFDSAATALNDAMTLGDNTGRTALCLALARIGQGHFPEAVALLDDWRTEIPAGDLGLALALAGEPARGVAVLTDAVRNGENNAKVRQNLAYAYALDGRWQDARIMAAQDVPADQLEKRMAFWALSTLPDRNRERVAVLLGAPVRLDPGQPVALALKSDPTSEQLAVETSAVTPPPTVVAAAAPVAHAAGELQAVAAVVPAVPQVAIAEPAPQPAIATAPTVAEPVVQKIAPTRQTVSQAFGVAVAAATRTKRHSVPTVALALPTTVRGTHYVQLGAFSSQQGARRAWGIYTRHNAGLAAYRMTITPANVRGKAVWRVAAGGLVGKQAANNLCSSFKSRGGSCFAYVAPSALPLPNAPVRGAVGPQMARR